MTIQRPQLRPVEPRTTTIEGRRVLIVERRPPLPETLQLIIEGGRDSAGRRWLPIRLIERHALRLLGTRSECYGQDHRLSTWLEGFHTGSDGAGRLLRLEACVDCGSVCVRDVSLDRLDRLPVGSSGPARRNAVLGWYSGARRGQRVYS